MVVLGQNLNGALIIMKQKIDFVLEDEKDIYRDIFRFYPRRTHVHGFEDDPPTNWSKVYKVYYTWAIIRQYYDDENNIIVPEESETLFEIECDECSMIPNLSDIIRRVMNTGETFDYPTFGQPAGDWRIDPYTYKDFHGKSYETYKFQVFNNWTNQGVVFTLNKEETLKFIDYLERINQYALEHGEGI